MLGVHPRLAHIADVTVFEQEIRVSELVVDETTGQDAQCRNTPRLLSLAK